MLSSYSREAKTDLVSGSIDRSIISTSIVLGGVTLAQSGVKTLLSDTAVMFSGIKASKLSVVTSVF